MLRLDHAQRSVAEVHRLGIRQHSGAPGFNPGQLVGEVFPSPAHQIAGEGRLAGARGGHQGERCAVERHAPGVQRPLPAAAEHGQPVAQHPHAFGDRLRRDGPQQLPLGAPLNQVAALDARNGDIRTFGVGDGALDRWVDSQGVAHRFGCQHVETKIAVADGD